MLSANLGLINEAINNVFTFSASHFSESYLHAAYSGLVSSVLTIQQLFV